MAQRISFVCDDHLVERVDALAREYNLPRQEVMRQLLTTGLKEIDR